MLCYSLIIHPYVRHQGKDECKCVTELCKYLMTDWIFELQ